MRDVSGPFLVVRVSSKLSNTSPLRVTDATGVAELSKLWGNIVVIPYGVVDLLKDDLDSPEQYWRMSVDERRAISGWIEQHISPSKSVHANSSYGLKHLCEESLGFYISNGAFKGAMLAMGYEPVEGNKQNWSYKILLKQA